MSLKKYWSLRGAVHWGGCFATIAIADLFGLPWYIRLVVAVIYWHLVDKILPLED